MNCRRCGAPGADVLDVSSGPGPFCGTACLDLHRREIPPGAEPRVRTESEVIEVGPLRQATERTVIR